MKFDDKLSFSGHVVVKVHLSLKQCKGMQKRGADTRSRDNKLITWLQQIQTKNTRAAAAGIANRRPETELSFFVLHYVAVFYEGSRENCRKKGK